MIKAALRYPHGLAQFHTFQFSTNGLSALSFLLSTLSFLLFRFIFETELKIKHYVKI